MNIDIHHQGGEARLVLKGRFDFSCRHVFKQACDDAITKPEVSALLVDLSDLEYLDSAALGMLLLLSDKSKAAGKLVSLAARPGIVSDVLHVARFDKLFTLRAMP